MSSKLTRLCLVSSRHEPWTLNAGFNSPSIQATGNSPALPARRPLKGAPKFFRTIKTNTHSFYFCPLGFAIHFNDRFLFLKLLDKIKILP
jgi:hypothetical protein